jgi:outer membrane biosynthesis protein TonB
LAASEAVASGMGKSAILSGLLHLAVLLLAVFGLPWLHNTNEVIEATPVTTISAAQFAQRQSKKPPAQKKQEEPKQQEIPPAPAAPDVAQPEPDPEEPAPPEPAPAVEPAPQPPPEPPQQAELPPEPPRPPEPAVQPEPPQPEPQVIAPEPPPQPKPEPVPAQEPQVAEAQPKPVPPKKPQPPKKKEEPKKKEQPKQEQVAADDTSFLKDIEKKLKKNQKKSQPQPQQQAALPPSDYDGPPLTQGEKDLIKQQIEDHTSIDPGMQGLDGFIVEVKVIMNPDGSVQSAKVDYSKSNPHPNWHIFAEACARAVNKSSPLRMPPEKPYEAWKQMTLVFHGKEMAHL